jgi:tRNA(Ile)-lysidine synthase
MGEFHLKAAACTITLEEEKVKSSDLGASPRVAYLDADCLTHPLKIRNFRPGDRFVPLGMKGRKKVKDFFVDLKIPFEARKRIPILTCGKTLFWVCGLRIDDRFKVTPKTRRILKVSFEEEAFRQTGRINRE